MFPVNIGEALFQVCGGRLSQQQEKVLAKRVRLPQVRNQEAKTEKEGEGKEEEEGRGRRGRGGRGREK